MSDPIKELSRQLSEAREECAKWRTIAERGQRIIEAYEDAVKTYHQTISKLMARLQ